ncbi:MAG: amidohydrolase [Gammaproteobacteria bacterium]|jgi:amidohydrolase
MFRNLIFPLVLTALLPAYAGADVAESLKKEALAAEPKVIEWRRHFHEHPELSNREFETAKKVAAELSAMGLEVETGIAHTGVVAYLEGGKPGPLVALRADMDALPVTEQVDLPFASEAKGTYRGREVGVMHACGHDTHMAMLLGAARALTAVREDLPGSVMFIFQPAEEGAPEGEEGGAELMLKEGIFDDRTPDAVFGLHVSSMLPAGMVGYRAGPAMASADRFEIVVRGRQTHGSRPWGGVDPIVVAAQIVTAAQSIISRQTDITRAPAVLSFGVIEGGIRNNIIPDEVTLIGTIRNFDMDIRDSIHRKLERTARLTAESYGATAETTIDLGYPVTVNDPELTNAMLPTVTRMAGEGRVIESPLITGAEDFSYYAQRTPGLFLFLGVTPPDQDPMQAPSNHSPLFYVDESALVTGVRLLTGLTLDFMRDNPQT